MCRLSAILLIRNDFVFYSQAVFFFSVGSITSILSPLVVNLSSIKF